MERVDEEDDVVCLDESFFINDDYQLTTFTFGSHVIQLLCLQSASTDFDLTGQLVWPGAMLLNDFLSNNSEMLQGCSVLELGSGVGITGILCSKFCKNVLLTDHNEEVLKILNKNIQLQESSENPIHRIELAAEKLEWGNSDQVIHILSRYSGGFDLILGADILEQLLRVRVRGQCKFMLAYVSRSKMMDSMIFSEASLHGMQMTEVAGTRREVGNVEGVIYEIILL